MPEPITISLPCPPDAVRPNGRRHWAVKAKAVKACRDRAYWECQKHKPSEPWTRASVRYDWFHPTRRLLDRDNIIGSCKAYLDGVVQAGVLTDDNGVTLEPVGRFVDSKHPRVEITITTLDQEPDPNNERTP